jgi:uncharacterized protein YuzE
MEKRNIPLQIVSLIFNSSEQILEEDGLKVYGELFTATSNKFYLIRIYVNDKIILKKLLTPTGLVKSTNIRDRTMKAEYDAVVDVLTVRWSDRAIEESDSVSPGVVLDYDREGNVIGIEILNASEKIENFSPPLRAEMI